MPSPPEIAAARLQQQIDVVQDVAALLLHILRDRPEVDDYAQLLKNELRTLDPKFARNAGRLAELRARLEVVERRGETPNVEQRARW